MFSVHCSKHTIPTEPSTVLRFDMFDTNDDGLLSSLEVEQLVEHALREESQITGDPNTGRSKLPKRRGLQWFVYLRCDCHLEFPAEQSHSWVCDRYAKKSCNLQ